MTKAWNKICFWYEAWLHLIINSTRRAIPECDLHEWSVLVAHPHTQLRSPYSRFIYSRPLTVLLLGCEDLSYIPKESWMVKAHFTGAADECIELDNWSIDPFQEHYVVENGKGENYSCVCACLAVPTLPPRPVEKRQCTFRNFKNFIGEIHSVHISKGSRWTTSY